MARIILLIFTFFNLMSAFAQQTVVYHPQIATVTVMRENDWRSLPVIPLQGDQRICVDFDCLDTNFHRFLYKIEHCEADWTVSEGLFTTDIANGFLEDLEIAHIAPSVNTTIPYTHYAFAIPNERVSLKLSGNHKITVYDADEDNQPVFTCCFMVVDKKVGASLKVNTNTDIDINNAHQQIDFRVTHSGMVVTSPQTQFKTVVLQNHRWDNAVFNPQPQTVNQQGLTWQHNRQLIFDGGNEYRKFEILDTDHPTMGIKDIVWDGNMTHAYLWPDEPRPNYVLAPSANGPFVIRNSDNTEIHTTTDYVDVHFMLKIPRQQAPIYINGNFTNGRFEPPFRMEYSTEENQYQATIRLKQGYYSYQYLEATNDGKLKPLTSEGNFYQTENHYQLLVYYRKPNGRTDELVGLVE